jgi:hypothetical protein
MSDNYDRQRRVVNESSREKADKYRQPWDADELDFLKVEFERAKGRPELEVVVAECLGRTVEACRQRYYEFLHGQGPSGRKARVVETKTEKTETTTTRRVEYLGVDDDPDDRWWASDYYTEGK